MPPERLVAGLITLISYHAPLPGETRFPEPGVAYYFPPLAAVPLSGPEERVRPLVTALEAGGMAARRHPDVARIAQFPSALMMPYLVALEAGGWKLARLGERSRTAARAAREAIAAVRTRGAHIPFFARLVAAPWILRAALWLGQRIVPLDLEVYLREHFTKVGDQTRLMIAQYIAAAHENGIAAGGLEELRESLLTPGKQLA